MNYLLRTIVLGALAVLGYLGYEQAVGVLEGHEAEVLEAERRVGELQTALDASGRRIDTLKDQVADRDRQIVSLEEDVAEAVARAEELDAALALLKVDRRLARLTVLGQQRLPDGTTETKVRFEEVGAGGESLGEAEEFTLQGKVAYIDSLVIKFGDDYVEQGDAFRGASLCLFRRMFSENQRPEDGFPLDRVGERPEPYTDDRTPDVVTKLWMRFWDYANDPQAAAAAGVRAIHGEAPYMELREGASYTVELRSSGGLSLRRD